MRLAEGKIRDTPRVTVLMPVLNAMPYLPDAVESILSQTFKNFVLYAIDDGSTDGSVAFLQSVKDLRVVIWSGEGHAGLGNVLNCGLAMTETELVARMDADDICKHDRLQKQVEFLDCNPSVGALGTQFTYLGVAGRTGFGRRLPLRHCEILQHLRNGDLALIHASLLMRTTLVRNIGGYRFSDVGEDWDMFLRLGEVTRLANLPDQSYLYRVHDNNASIRQRQTTLRRIMFARRCADARSRQIREPTEEEYLRELDTTPKWIKLKRTLDDISLHRYVIGRNLILRGQRPLGYCNLALGVVAGPWRLFSRLRSLIHFRGR